MSVTFTPVYDWIAEQKNLSLLEKLIICKVLRYGKNGCYESYRSMARKFGVDHSNLTKAVKGLIRKDWLCVLYESKNKRILYVVPDRLSAGPLFNLNGVNVPRAVVKTTKNVVHTPHVVNMYDTSKKEKIQKLIYSSAELMRDKARPTTAEFERRRQELIKSLKG